MEFKPITPALELYKSMIFKVKNTEVKFILFIDSVYLLNSSKKNCKLVMFAYFKIDQFRPYHKIDFIFDSFII